MEAKSSLRVQGFGWAEVVCTASPCASDTEHTLSTLRTGVPKKQEGRVRMEQGPEKSSRMLELVVLVGGIGAIHGAPTAVAFLEKLLYAK